MSNLIRKTVSKKKRRYQKQGFDLDLSYITDKLIAMGFPSESVEGVYRNPFKEVFRFLELMHKDHYKVYNLCSERSYDISKFHNRVECFPFDDHNCPTLELVMKFCANVQEWILAHDKNVAVIHCKAGKGRTGLMICCYMLFSKEWNTPKDALDFYAAMRTYNKKGVTIPSQIRYVHYLGSIMNNYNGLLPEPQTLLLKNVIFHTIPNVSHAQDIKFSTYVFKTLVYTHKDTPKLRGGKKLKEKKKKEEGEDVEEEESLVFEVPGIPLCGDVKIDVYEKDTFGSDRLLCFWFNTLFVNENNVIELKKEELDKADKDKGCKIFKDNFKISLVFDTLDKDNLPSTTQLTSSASVPSIVSHKLSNSLGAEKSRSTPELPLAEKMKLVNADMSKSLVSLTDKDKDLTDDEDEDDEDDTIVEEDSIKDPCLLIEDLLSKLIELRIVNKDMKLSAIKGTNEFNLYKQKLLSSLKDLSLEKLVSAQEKLTFWINTYNLLVMYSNLCKSPSRSDPFEERLKSARRRSFIIGGQSYSLLDIEFAVLRASKEVPSHLTDLSNMLPKISSEDVRFSYIVDNKDPRVLFAICKGNASSPRIHVYHVNTVFEQLDAAITQYLQQNITVDNDSKTVTLPKLLEWYYKDFGKSTKAMIKAISGYLTADQKNALNNSYTIQYQDYSWSFTYELSHFLQEKKK